MYILAPSLLAADFAVLGQQIEETERMGAKYLHIDVMDGVFVPSISFGMPVLASIHDVTDQVIEIKGVKLLAARVSGVDMNGLRELGDQLKEKLGEGVVLLISEKDGRVNMVAMATEEAIGKGAHAGNMIKEIASCVGGGGGGRPNMAQAGGKNPAGMGKAMNACVKALEEQIEQRQSSKKIRP